MSGSDRNILISKQGQAVAALARDLLNSVPGERIGRMQEYATRLDSSVGTIQAALEFLQTAGAASLDARGRLGTFARVLDYVKLWTFGPNRPIIGALPLPYSRRFAGLATGIREQFAQQPIALDLRFLRGAAQRIQTLNEGLCDWVLVSRFAAATMAVSAETFVHLGPGTYMPDHILLLRTTEPVLRDGMRVGIDRQSLDHTYAVETACRGVQVEFIPIDYSQGAALVGSGEIDATVWSHEDLPLEPERFAIVPFDGHGDPAIRQLAEATILVRHGDRAIRAVLGVVINAAALIQTQQAVVAMQRRPAY